MNIITISLLLIVFHSFIIINYFVPFSYYEAKLLFSNDIISYQRVPARGSFDECYMM